MVYRTSQAVFIFTLAALGCSAQPAGDSIADLLAALHNPAEETRAQASALLGVKVTLGQVPPVAIQSVFAAQLAALQDSSPRVRGFAAAALGTLKDRRATAALIKATEDPNEPVRARVITSLGQLRDPAALPRLLELERSGSESDKRNAGFAIRAIQTGVEPQLPRELSESQKQALLRSVLSGPLVEATAADAADPRAAVASPQAAVFSLSFQIEMWRTQAVLAMRAWSPEQTQLRIVRDAAALKAFLSPDPAGVHTKLAGRDFDARVSIVETIAGQWTDQLLRRFASDRRMLAASELGQTIGIVTTLLHTLVLEGKTVAAEELRSLRVAFETAYASAKAAGLPPDLVQALNSIGAAVTKPGADLAKVGGSAENGISEWFGKVLDTWSEPGAVSRATAERTPDGQREGARLIAVAASGDLEAVQTLLAGGAGVNTMDEAGATAVMRASGNGHEAIVKMLMARGADVNIRARNSGKTALMVSAQEGHTAVVSALLKGGANPNGKDQDGATALHYAVMADRLEVARELLRSGIDPDVSTLGTGATALHVASQRGNAALVRLLVSFRANVNAANPQGITVLISAANNAHPEVVKVLLDAGANVQARTSAGVAALTYAAAKDLACVEALLAKGADINARQKNGGTALMAAARTGKVEIVRLLIARGADISAKFEDGRTAAAFAAAEGHLEIVRLLEKVPR